jgi:Tfp pilus assembly protein PilF
MYTQILKEILLTIDFEQEKINAFLTYCRELLAGNTIELKNVDKIEKEYRDHQLIWWYTYQSFLYSMLNRALRTMEVDLIVKMGFFVRDLHNQIVALHAEQYGGQSRSDSFTIYRGQGLSQTDFDQLKQTQGGLLSFNNFLSTSQNYDVSLRFARRSMTNSDLAGVLFVLKIDPSISATPFADVGNVSYYKEKEKEILFAMHSVFRIGQVKQIGNNNCLWQVDLTITSDNDPQLHALTETMRKETASAHKGWHRLGELMIKVGQFGKAEELYRIILQQTTAEIETASIFDQLGWIKDNQGEYAEAVGFYEKSLEILQKALPENHPDLATSCNHIDGVYLKMSENSKALSFYERDLEISEKILPANHPDLAISYNNIGLVYKNMGEYSKALSYHEKALEIRVLQPGRVPGTRPDPEHGSG